MTPSPAPADGGTLPSAPPASSGPTMPDGITGWPVCLSETQLGNRALPPLQQSGPSDRAHRHLFPRHTRRGRQLRHAPVRTIARSASWHLLPVDDRELLRLPHRPHRDRSTLWADIPYNADPPHCNAANPRPNGSADPSIGSLSHEHNETITDPLTTPGQQAWIDSMGNENGDLCALKFGPPLGGSSGPTAYNEVIGTGHYLIQEEWSNEDAGGSTDPNVGCKASDENDSLAFTLAPSITPGSTLTLNPTAIDPDGSIVSYGWNFGTAQRPPAGPRSPTPTRAPASSRSR